MRCPSCKSVVADDAAVCPKCDAVLDPSLAEPAPKPKVRTKTGVQGAAKPKTGVRTGVRPATKKPGGTAARPAAKPAADADKPGNWRDKVDPEDWNQQNNRPPPKVHDIAEPKIVDPEAFISNTMRMLSDLSAADKLAFFGSLGMAFACLAPWKETAAEGEFIGAETLGAVTLVLALVAAVSVIVRATGGVKNVMLTWSAQLGGIVFGMFWCLVCLKLFWDSTTARAQVGNMETWTSRPNYGLFMAFLGGVVAALGTVLGIREPRS